GPFNPVVSSSWFGTTTTHRSGLNATDQDKSHVDIAFYTSSCGDGQLDNSPGSEQCDLGGSNGSATSCCTSTCTFRASGQACRTTAGVCDVQETCTGSAATCPTDLFATSGVCRPSGGVCDPAESCNGSGPNCPADTKSTSQCRASAGVCDVAENCDGVNNG